MRSTTPAWPDAPYEQTTAGAAAQTHARPCRPDPCAALTAEIIERARGIRLLVSDFDGVLTDGGGYYSGAGEVSKPPGDE
ncbi:MAG: hypothetical protein ACREXU_10595 [Gammaproteobacteria bacterium]